MATDYTTDIIKVIIKGIVQECAENGESISESLAVFMLRIVTLDPEWTLTTKDSITEESIRMLIKTCAERLLVPCSPTTMTLKMQVYFELNYKKREDFLKQHHHNLSMKLMPVLRTITSTIARSSRDLDVLYHQIIAYLILRTGMGNARDATAVREAKVATESIFPLSQLHSFMLMNKKDKRDHLEELAQIVAGIRLYNREIGKGGAAVHNVASILIEAAPLFADKIKNEQDKTNVLMQKLTAILEYHVLKKAQSRDFNPEELATADQEDNFLFLKKLLANAHQYRFYLDALLVNAIDIVKRAHELQVCLKTRLQQLHTAVQARCTLASHEVFPLFAGVSQVWSVIQEEVVLLSTYSSIARNLRTCSEGARALLEENDIKQLLSFIDSDSPSPHAESVTSVDSQQKTAKAEGTQSPHKSDSPVQSPGKVDEATVKPTGTTQKTAASGSDSAGKGSSGMPQKEQSTASTEKQSKDTGIQCDTTDVTEDDNVAVIFPHQVKNFEEISLQYQGFCPWAIVCGRGVLMFADRFLGIVSHEGCCYGFSCKIGGQCFMQRPHVFVNEVANIAMKFPELILLLQLHDYFHVPTWYTSEISQQISAPIFISNSGTQTEIHPIEPYKDYTYRWNEWDLRKQALKTADLRQRMTHSTQTCLSHFRRENYSQVYLPKPNWSQTKRDGGTTMPKLGVPDLIIKQKKGLLKKESL